MNTTSLASALDSLFGTISTCDSIFAKNGSTKGLISAANLASVLGVGNSAALNATEVGSVSNINNMTGVSGKMTIMFCAPSSVPSNMPSGFSSGTRFFLEILNNSNYYIVQKIFGTGGDVYVRFCSGSSWSSWIKL